jgi:hypothetical protein
MSFETLWVSDRPMSTRGEEVEVDVGVVSERVPNHDGITTEVSVSAADVGGVEE